MLKQVITFKWSYYKLKIKCFVHCGGKQSSQSVWIIIIITQINDLKNEKII